MGLGWTPTLHMPSLAGSSEISSQQPPPHLVEEGENLEEEGPVVLSSVSLEGEVMERRGLEEVGSSSVAPALQ